jgi:hypothetical protein
MRATGMPLGSARRLCLLALALLLQGCPGENMDGGSTTPPGPPPAGIALSLEPINTTDLSFPVFATAPPGDAQRLFVVEKGGAIKILDRDTGALIGTFLNIGGLVLNSGEQGLLGLAFDPQYTGNRRFYVNYTNTSGNSVTAVYLAVPGNPNLADSNSGSIILTVPHPTFDNHNGGMIAFGPDDNFLYIALGDGGSGGDPNNRAQNTAELLGKLLRIGVSSAPPYTIPFDNPFVMQAGADEIWSFGLRNPWRFSFDRETGDLYIGDVGQGAREEVNASTAASGAGRGVNYGWKIMEGTLCFSPVSGCNMAGLTLPVIDYDSSNPSPACSVTGGYVYRGAAIPALRGTYFYADYCAGFVRSFRLVNGMVTEHAEWPTLAPGGNITSFGEDAAGELYIVTQQGGLFRIVPN